MNVSQFFFLLDGPGMSFVEGIVCPQASQKCCDRLTKSMSLQKQLEKSDRNFKSEYSFQTGSVATNLMASLEINPTQYATMLCQFGQTRNVSVTALFLLLSSTATHSATGDYVAAPECFAQNEEPTSCNKERARNKTSWTPKP